MGLNPHRDRLCVVQLSPGDGTRRRRPDSQGRTYDAPNLKASCWPIRNVSRCSISPASTWRCCTTTFGVVAAPVYCTKIASRLTRTYTDRHGLKDLVRELLGVDLSKQQQSSDWGADNADRRAAARLCRVRRCSRTCTR
jgi:ribonuclease D